MHCVICDFSEDLDGKNGWNKVVDDPVMGAPVCRRCIKASKSYSTNIADGPRIEKDLAELEERIPDLFYGPVCPSNCRCDCTTVCLALAKLNGKVYDINVEDERSKIDSKNPMPELCG